VLVSEKVMSPAAATKVALTMNSSVYGPISATE